MEAREKIQKPFKSRLMFSKTKISLAIGMAALDFAILAISSVVAVMEPFSTIAVYATLTKTMSPEKKRKILAKSMKISFAD